MKALSQCLYCIHFKPEYRGDNRCAAFPGGIPREIRFGDFDHTNAYKGDNGIRFELHTEGPARFAGTELPAPPQKNKS